MWVITQKSAAPVRRPLDCRVRAMAKKKPTLVQIEWRDDGSDWPWFWLLGTNGEWLHLQGADYPDGSAKHDGDCFWAHKSDVQTMRSNVGNPPIRPQQ